MTIKSQYDVTRVFQIENTEKSLVNVYVLNTQRSRLHETYGRAVRVG